jgi:hypothetical protein
MCGYDILSSSGYRDNLGHDQSRILFVVGGHEIPRGIARARRAQAFLVGLHIVLPEFAFFDVGGAEFPVLFGLVDAGEETLPLLLLREMKEEFDDAGAVGMEMPFQIRDRPINGRAKGLCRRPARRSLSLSRMSRWARTISTSS